MDKLEALLSSGPDVSESSIFSEGILASIGNTPLLEIRSFSNATGCQILAKAEFLNPAGSIKDRAALRIVAEAEATGLLVPPSGSWKAGGKASAIKDDEKTANMKETDKSNTGNESNLSTPTYTIIEGTGGNTGIGLAMVAAARGYHCHVFAPENCSAEKIAATRLYGGTVTVCPLVPFEDPAHFYQRTAAHAVGTPHTFWGNQFESLANARAHASTTGPEVWRQTGGNVDAIALSSGTGGTLAGLSLFLKSRNPKLQAYLVDPQGSSLRSYVQQGTMDVLCPGKTIAEGIGINRITANFAAATVDGAVSVDDRELVAAAHYLLKREGLCVGPSAALNLCGAVKLARKMGPGHTIVTILCDGGERYASKLFNKEWLKEKGFDTTVELVDACRDHADFVE